MAENEKLYTLKCKDCRKYFEWHSRNKRVCPECEKARELVRKKKQYERNKSTKFKKTPVNYSVNELVGMVERYNQQHKTKYTYGSFVELIRCGTINLENNDDEQRKKGDT